MNMTTLTRKKLVEVAYSFRGLVHYHHDGIWWQIGRYGDGEGAE